MTIISNVSMNIGCREIARSVAPGKQRAFSRFWLFVVLCIFAASATAQQRKSNIILILADDLGYETIGANGGTSYATPALDKLAATGARFTHAYAQPLCTPTCVRLMRVRLKMSLRASNLAL